ncbi:glycosyltransferase [Cereibacter sp. SYSU M97828]|nr:glycosyltransferase [Cereibacter flavus]
MFEVTSSRPAKTRRAIVLCCDDAYLPYAAMALDRIAALSHDRDFDLCLCSSVSMLALPKSLAHLDIRSCHVDIGNAFDGLRLDPGRTADIYLRLGLPAAFSKDYDRILYLDSDIFVQRGDFGALLSVDLGGHAIGAIRDNTQWRTPGRRPEQFRRLGLPAAPYFNAGVLLMDVAACNAGRILDRCVKLGRENAALMIRHDQNLYNAVLRGDWAELSPLWNWQYTWSSRLFETMADANVVHFIGNRKPWGHVGGEFPLRFRRAYRAFNALHFPQNPVPADDGIHPIANEGFLRKMLLKHLFSHRRMARYLSRFPTDLTVVT